MTLQQFIDFLNDTDNNIFNIIVSDEYDQGKIEISKIGYMDCNKFYLDMISVRALNSEIKNIYINNELAEITTYSRPRINKQGAIIK